MLPHIMDVKRERLNRLVDCGIGPQYLIVGARRQNPV